MGFGGKTTVLGVFLGAHGLAQCRPVGRRLEGGQVHAVAQRGDLGWIGPQFHQAVLQRLTHGDHVVGAIGGPADQPAQR